MRQQGGTDRRGGGARPARGRPRPRGAARSPRSPGRGFRRSSAASRRCSPRSSEPKPRKPRRRSAIEFATEAAIRTEDFRPRPVTNDHRPPKIGQAVTPDVVVDIGNIRMKWGRVPRRAGRAMSLRLPLDDPAAWDADAGEAPPPRRCPQVGGGERQPAGAAPVRGVVARPRRHACVFEKYTDLPIRVNVDEPEKVGIDRLLRRGRRRRRWSRPARPPSRSMSAPR